MIFFCFFSDLNSIFPETQDNQGKNRFQSEVFSGCGAKWKQGKRMLDSGQFLPGFGWC
jgi:hypothetical protein